jgi:hypothetical protein
MPEFLVCCVTGCCVFHISRRGSLMGGDVLFLVVEWGVFG